MKLFILLIIGGFLISNSVYSQNASTYFPSSTGYKWYYKNIPLDSNNNPQVNLTTYRIDTFAVVTTYNGLSANVVRLKDYLISFLQNTPYNDTNYFNFQTTNGWEYLSVSMFPDSIPLPGILNFFRSMENWYSVFRFAQNVGSQYTIVQKDTTIQVDTISAPLRAKITGTRFNDETVSTVYGNFTAKKFVTAYGLYLHVIIIDIPIIVRPDTTWLAQNMWMIKKVTPTVNINLSNFGIPVNIPIPGNMYELSLPPTAIRNISAEIPDNYNLSQNYPNPFNPVTKIKFDIPSSVRRQTSNVKLIIYDISGKEVRTLVNEQLQPGSYEVTFEAASLSSGVYFYKLEKGSYSKVLKMALIK